MNLKSLMAEAKQRQIPFTSVIFDNVYTFDYDDLITLVKELCYTIPNECEAKLIENLLEYGAIEDDDNDI